MNRNTALLALLPLLAPGAGRPEPELCHPWGRWQPGAWVETRTATTGVAGELAERSQLVRFTPDGYDLTATLVQDGQPSGQPSAQHLDWGFGGYAYAMPGARRVGDETLRVGAQEHACEVWEGSFRQGDQAFVCRSWTAPGFDLPLRMRMASQAGGFELVLVEPDAFVSIAGRKRKAARYEGSGQAAGASLQTRQWLTLEVPGAVARSETVVQHEGESRSVVREVTSFRCTPRATR